jgi:hypothetical protein
MDQIEASPAVYEDGAMTLSRAVTTISYLHRVKGIKVFFFDRKELFDLSGIDAKGRGRGGILYEPIKTPC